MINVLFCTVCVWFITYFQKRPFIFESLRSVSLLILIVVYNEFELLLLLLL